MKCDYQGVVRLGLLLLNCTGAYSKKPVRLCHTFIQTAPDCFFVTYLLDLVA